MSKTKRNNQYNDEIKKKSSYKRNNNGNFQNKLKSILEKNKYSKYVDDDIDDIDILEDI